MDVVQATAQFGRQQRMAAEGGPMSHAAVLSRELGIPAVVGAPDAMSSIADGDRIEVDPRAGRVRVVGGTCPAE